MPDICLVIASDPFAVRSAVEQVFRDLEGRGTDPDLCERAVIVLAEVLNNIVEHAYASGAGEITVEVSLRSGGVHCLVRDSGLAMPDLRLPAGIPAPLNPESMPEGGFGWFLIRNLAQELHYLRRAGINELQFLVVGHRKC